MPLILQDANMFWDFISLRPETTHQVMITFSDRGIPDGYRYMHGYGSHTFKMVNKQNEAVYVKFHYKVHHLLHAFYCHHKSHCLVYIKCSQLPYITQMF